MSFEPESFSAGVAVGSIAGPTAALLIQTAATAVVAAEDAAQSVVTKPYAKEHAILAVRDYTTGEVLCATDHFLLASLNEPEQERSSFQLTFGDPTLYAGPGRNPRIYSYSGFLADTLASGPGIAQWRAMYDLYFRGTQCARYKALAHLYTRDFYRTGIILSCSLGIDATRPRVASMSFNMNIIKEG